MLFFRNCRECDAGYGLYMRPAQPIILKRRSALRINSDAIIALAYSAGAVRMNIGRFRLKKMARRSGQWHIWPSLVSRKMMTPTQPAREEIRSILKRPQKVGKIIFVTSPRIAARVSRRLWCTAVLAMCR
jgi:hypothetical protein